MSVCGATDEDGVRANDEQVENGVAAGTNAEEIVPGPGWNTEASRAVSCKSSVGLQVTSALSDGVGLFTFVDFPADL